MNDRIAISRCLKNDIITEDNINELLSEIEVSKTRTIKILFKYLFEYISELEENNCDELKKLIYNDIYLIAYICSKMEFNNSEIEINRNRIKKARESLLAFANKSKDIDLYLCADKLDEIILDKYTNVEDLIKLIKILIDKKENCDIIKKFINANKNIIILDKYDLFEYTFDYACEALKNNSRDIYYYTTLLKLFYHTKIDKDYYIKKLNSLNIDSTFVSEITFLLFGIKRSLSPHEILNKYGINTDLKDKDFIFIQNERHSPNTIITIDDENTKLRDDGISIEKDGDKYIIGIHIADAGKNIIPNSMIDNQAINNFKNAYGIGIRILPTSYENNLSLNASKRRNVISLYIVMNDSGEILDYYLDKQDINVNRNLTYDEANKLMKRKDNKQYRNMLDELYILASTIENNDLNRKLYIRRKNSTNSTDIQSKSSMIVREFMILYNILLGKIAYDNNIPYIYRYQDEQYISSLANDLNIKLDDQTDKMIKCVYLDGKYSSEPKYHASIGTNYYTQSSDPLRKYPDLYTQYLLHKFYFKDIDFDFDFDKYIELINYFNQREREITLMKSEYTRGLRLVK